jgi:hypothetical protein
LNPTNGTASLVGPLHGNGFIPDGTRYACSFNPVTDALQVLTDAGGFFSVDPATGTLTSGFAAPDFQYVAADPNVGAPVELTCIAYTNQVHGATTTTAGSAAAGLDRAEGADAIRIDDAELHLEPNTRGRPLPRLR